MTRWYLLLLTTAFLFLHAGFGFELHRERPRLGILPPLISEQALDAASLGDRQFTYRSLVMQIQNAGDTGGRFTPMSQYNMNQVLPWLGVLQSLDPRSSHYTVLAVRYFSIGRSLSDLRSLIYFIDHDVDLAPQRKWFWQTEAVALARDRLKDIPLALALSRKLSSFATFLPPGYAWVIQTEPVLLARLGRNSEAHALMEDIVRSYGQRMTEQEKNWTRQFLTDQR